MQTVKQLVHSLTDKLQHNELGTSSRTGTETQYPAWLRDFFALMSATYGGLWNEQFLDEVTAKAVKRVWYIHLKDFPPEIIREGVLQASGKFEFIPRPSQVKEILRDLEQRKKDRETFRIMEETRLLPKPPKLPPTREVLEAKLKMWCQLGRMDKAKEVEDALAHMDLQEK